MKTRGEKAKALLRLPRPRRALPGHAPLPPYPPPPARPCGARLLRRQEVRGEALPGRDTIPREPCQAVSAGTSLSGRTAGPAEPPPHGDAGSSWHSFGIE